MAVLLGAAIMQAPQPVLGGPGGQRPASLSGLAVDAAGNLYIADNTLGLIRKITPEGVGTIVAGIGTRGFSGDGGLATAAQITPQNLAVDRMGNIFITSGDVVRKVNSATGVISVVAGIPGRAGSSPIGTPVVFGVVGDADDGKPAKEALIKAGSVAVDGQGNLFIAGNYFDLARIRKVNAEGMITTVADGRVWQTNGLVFASGIAADSAGNLFISDQTTHRVWKLAPGGALSTIAGVGTARMDPGRELPQGAGPNGYQGDGGAATNAWLNVPGGLAVDARGNVFIAEINNSRIRKVDVSGVITTVAGNGTNTSSGDGGPATSAGIRPLGIAVAPDGTLYILEGPAVRGGSAVRKVSPSGIISTVVLPRPIAATPRPAGLRRIASAENLPPFAFLAALALLTGIVAARGRRPTAHCPATPVLPASRAEQHVDLEQK